jgi:predicted DNA-binding helix-hairpin-helix protein
MTRVLINICSIEELMSLPGIGAKVADKILELRDAKGDLELDYLNQVPYLRLTPQLINCLGSLYDRSGMGQDRAKQQEGGRIGVNLTSPINRRKVLS